MRITSLKIENFRSIKSLDLELGETTVFIGPNNAGKTAILDAVRIALTRRWGCVTHAAGTLEEQLLADGLEVELRIILETIGYTKRA
jgi:predicted ATPase